MGRQSGAKLRRRGGLQRISRDRHHKRRSVDEDIAPLLIDPSSQTGACGGLARTALLLVDHPRAVHCFPSAARPTTILRRLLAINHELTRRLLHETKM